MELEPCLVLKDGAAQGRDCITEQSSCWNIEFPSDQWDHSAGLSLVPGAQDDSGSYCHVGSEVLACPTSFYLGKCWSQVHSGPSMSADLLHSACGTQRLHKPVGIQSPPSLLGSGGSLTPLVLCAGLWTSPVLAVLLPTHGHLLLPELVFPPSAVSGKRFHVFVALTNNEA